MALGSGHLEVVRLLCYAGAEKDEASHEGASPGSLRRSKATLKL